MTKRTSTIHGISIQGTEASTLTFEVEPIPQGLEIVGLSEHAARESRVRIRAACHSAGLELPNIRVTILGAPLRLRSSPLDLPLALAALESARPESTDALPTFAFGELSLSGQVRSCAGRFLAAEHVGRGVLVTFRSNESCVPVCEVSDLAQAVRYVFEPNIAPPLTEDTSGRPLVPSLDGYGFHDLPETFDPDVLKQVSNAVAAGKNILLVGPPGSGKTMIARRIVSLFPAPTSGERRTLRRIASVAGLPEPRTRPFRAPHHIASVAAIVGGGDPIRPGEATLAHGGVLFLDELPEFARPALAELETVLEHGSRRITRAGYNYMMPAKPLVVAAMNDCPCGYTGAPAPRGACTCTPARIEAYHARVAPFVKALDMVRIDIKVNTRQG